MNYMEYSLSLARRSLGLTSPNPAVGAVVVRDGKLVGEGHTKPPGQAHAEIVALDQAGEAASGADLYVTLEPCCFEGRTPPCTQAIIQSGVARVHIATLDPNPKVSGKGTAELERAGLEVCMGEEEKEARRLNEAYIKFITTQLPFVTAKYAASLDGKIATRSGQSRWITGEEARRRAHDLRRIADVVMVGANTVEMDNPRLTVRDSQGAAAARQPARVVVDSRGRVSPDSLMFRQPGCSMVAVCEIELPSRKRMREVGVEVLVAPRKGPGVDLAALLALLGQRNYTHVLVEGGGTLLGAFFDEGLVDKVVAFVAPAIIGGKDTPSAVGGLGAEVMEKVLRLRDVEVETLGGDIVVTGYP
ncbi:MAG: bifunctional diaminohydroxyphosphoribosylaminopyrimidine deaminase/5-amino-6-(5-phosphoribosylamino)uracil reductase RibD [Chloroflexi bacterium]|nr:bifunctional diaminohydroxyphosphoribosylaminopyrimidine deaminase/5-amino-6-(5-phosphoribosylamino)uracil reductase RibD [Chloroflexota bacterium]